jgi:hypothetical protein
MATPWDLGVLAQPTGLRMPTAQVFLSIEACYPTKMICMRYITLFSNYFQKMEAKPHHFLAAALFTREG